MELEGKTAIVTGASRGIGKAISLALAQAGASVVVASRTQTEPTADASELAPAARQDAGLLPGTIHGTVSEIEAMGREATAVACDVSKESDVENLAARAVERFDKVDIVVNNAAVFHHARLLKITPELFERVMSVNVLGYYLVCKHVLPGMMERGSGSIINVTAGAATSRPGKARLGRNNMPYGMSKAAVNRMTTYIAEEVREYGIAVNALIPGIIRTPGYENSLPKNFDPAKEGVAEYPSSPEVFFEPVTFLASQTAAGLTGQVVHNMEYGKTWP